MKRPWEMKRLGLDYPGQNQQEESNSEKTKNTESTRPREENEVVYRVPTLSMIASNLSMLYTDPYHALQSQSHRSRVSPKFDGNPRRRSSESSSSSTSSSSSSSSISSSSSSSSGLSDHSNQCAECGKSLATRFGLKVHMRIHSGEKPYTCEVCGHSFTQSGNLKMHQRTHKRKMILDQVFQQHCYYTRQLQQHTPVAIHW